MPILLLRQNLLILSCIGWWQLYIGQSPLSRDLFEYSRYTQWHYTEVNQYFCSNQRSTVTIIFLYRNENLCFLYFLSTERLSLVNLGRYTAWCYSLCELIYILVILWTKDTVSLELSIILPYNVSISSSILLPEPWGQVFGKNISAPFHLWIYLLIIFYCKKTFS